MQLIIKVLSIILFFIFNLYVSFIFVRIVLTKEINIKYPLKWIKEIIEKSIPTTTSGINISPEKLVLKTKQWKGMSLINISNTTSEVIYDLYIKLIIEDQGLASEHVEITPVNESNLVEGRLGEVSVNYDTVKVWGTDSRNKEAIFLIIYSLVPHENKSFRIDVNKALDSNTEEASMSVHLIKYSKEPAQILSQGQNKLAFPIKFTENVKIKGTSLLMKKSKQ